MVQFHTMRLLNTKEFIDAKTSQALKNIKDNEQLLVVGFSFTDPKSITIFHEMVSRYDGKKKAIGRPKEVSNQLRLRDVGGAISLISLDPKNVSATALLSDIDVSVPMGLCYRPKDEKFYVGSHESIIVIKNGKVIGELHNNLFSDIHTVRRSVRGLYVVCTATDSIVEIDPDSPSVILWDWLATEHGFTLAPNGQEIVIDRTISYKDIEGDGTRSHTTHINCVEDLDEDHLLATLFHQDALIKINKETGDYEYIMKDFINPHGIHRINDGFILSDTKGERVVIFDQNLNVKEEIKGDFKWIQDSIEFKDHYLIADDNLATIFIYNKSLECVDKITWDHNMRKVSVMHPLTGKEAKKIFLND